MCYNYDNYIPGFEPGTLVNKYKLRVSERRQQWEQFKERFNFYYTSGFEHRELPVITMDKPGEIQFFHWGLIPHWTKTRAEADKIRKMTLNATCENVFTLPSFKGYIKSQRCLVPATGFYEWRHIESEKFPYHIMVKDDDFPDSVRDFNFGGIYSRWTDKDNGETLDTFSIITTPANSLMETIHNSKKRMPLIMTKEDEKLWLMPGLDEKQIKSLMKPYPDSHMLGYTISKLITSRGANRNVAAILEPFEYDGVESWLPDNEPMQKGLENLPEKKNGELF